MSVGAGAAVELGSNVTSLRPLLSAVHWLADEHATCVGQAPTLDVVSPRAGAAARAAITASAAAIIAAWCGARPDMVPVRRRGAAWPGLLVRRDARSPARVCPQPDSPATPRAT